MESSPTLKAGRASDVGGWLNMTDREKRRRDKNNLQYTQRVKDPKGILETDYLKASITLHYSFCPLTDATPAKNLQV